MVLHTTVVRNREFPTSFRVALVERARFAQGSRYGRVFVSAGARNFASRTPSTRSTRALPYSPGDVSLSNTRRYSGSSAPIVKRSASGLAWLGAGRCSIASLSFAAKSCSEA